MVADNWPAWMAVTRAALFDRADENLLVASYHFPFPGLGRVTKEEIGCSDTRRADTGRRTPGRLALHIRR